MQDRPDLRIALAVHQYQTDAALTLARAAALAGISLERMKDLLISRSVAVCLGSASFAEAEAAAALLGRRIDDDFA